MLSDVPRQQLAAIFTLNGKVGDDDRLCEAFLRDYCGEYRREIAALSAAVRWGIPKSLREDSQVPQATLRANLARRLQENHGLDQDNALWAVDAWMSVIRPQNAMPPAAPPDAARPASPRVSPPPAVDPGNGASRVTDWSQSPPAAAAPYAQPAVRASVLSPPVPETPVSTPQSPVAYPHAPVPQVMPGIPYLAAASAFLAGERNPELKAVQSYIGLQLKIRKPASLMLEIQAAGVAPGIAKNMVTRVRRGKALRALIVAILIVIAGFIMMGNGMDEEHELTKLGLSGFFIFASGCVYSLWSLIKVIRFS